MFRTVAVIAVCTVLLLAGLQATGANEPENAEARIKALETEVAKLEARITAQEVLLRTRTDAFQKKLDALDETYTRTLTRVAEIMGETDAQVGIEYPEGIEAAIKELSENGPSRNARYDAINLIADTGNKAVGATPTVIQVLSTSDDRYLRRLAATTLGDICSGTVGELPRQAVTALRTAATGDADDMVRTAAQDAIKRIMR